jgi:hypothetical protein
MEIKIKTITGTQFSYSVEDETTIMDIKYWIQDKIGIVASQQRFIYCGRTVSDTMNVKSLPHMAAGSTIHMILALRGG